MPSDQAKRYRAMVKINRGPSRDGFWFQVGRAWTIEDGRVAGQINLSLITLPVRPEEWDGTIALFPDEERE